MERNEGRGRVALVTGGASGIGLAIAGVLAGRGWRTVIADVDAERARAVAGPIGAEAVPFDVVDEAATEAAFVEIEGRIGPVEALIANAGLIQPGGLPEDRPMAEFDRIVAVNLRGVYVSCLAAGTRMAKRGRGGIVITGSVTAWRTAPLHAYAPTKAAVVHMAACLAAEWGRSGVRVNAVSPGYVATPPLQAAIDRGPARPAPAHRRGGARPPRRPRRDRPRRRLPALGRRRGDHRHQPAGRCRLARRGAPHDLWRDAPGAVRGIPLRTARSARSPPPSGRRRSAAAGRR